MMSDSRRLLAAKLATAEWAAKVARRVGAEHGRRFAQPAKMATMNAKPKSASVGVAGLDVVIIIDDNPEPARIVMRREDAVRLAEALRSAARRIGAAVADAGKGRDDG